MLYADADTLAAMQWMTHDRAIGMDREVRGRGGAENFHSTNLNDWCLEKTG